MHNMIGDLSNIKDKQRISNTQQVKHNMDFQYIQSSNLRVDYIRSANKNVMCQSFVVNELKSPILNQYTEESTRTLGSKIVYDLIPDMPILKLGSNIKQLSNHQESQKFMSHPQSKTKSISAIQKIANEQAKAQKYQIKFPMKRIGLCNIEYENKSQNIKLRTDVEAKSIRKTPNNIPKLFGVRKRCSTVQQKQRLTFDE